MNIQNLALRNLASLLAALMVVPPTLFAPQLARADEPVTGLDIIETQTPIEQLDQENSFRIDFSKMPPDDGLLDAIAPPTMVWDTQQNRAKINHIGAESRYLSMLRRTAVEEALKARGMLYLLIGGNSGIQSYLQTHERSGAGNLLEAICRLDPEHTACTNRNEHSPDLSFALPCETKALFNLYDSRCPDPRRTAGWGGHHATRAPSRPGRPRFLEAQSYQDDQRFAGKFESIRRSERFLSRPEPLPSDFGAEETTNSPRKLRDRVLGALIYHSLQLIELKRLEKFITVDLVRDVAYENIEGQENVSFELEADRVREQLTQRYATQLQRIAVAHDTILSQVPFISVRVGERPFYEFVYCFLQGRTSHGSTRYCGEGVGFPDFYAPLRTTSANHFVRSNEVVELPQGFRGPFRELMDELQSDGYQSLERRIMSHSGWALKKLLTEALAANTVSLAALSNAHPRFITMGGAGHMDHCRQIGRHCGMLENLARHDLLHDQTKRRFGTYLHADFFPGHTDTQNGMDLVRGRILTALQRADAVQDRVRAYVDYFLWGILAVQIGVTFGMGASISAPVQMATRYSLMTATVMNSAVAYGNHVESRTAERYLSALFQGIPGSISPDAMREAEEMTVNDLIQFNVSLMMVVSDIIVLDRIFRGTSLLLRGGIGLVTRTPGVRQLTLSALQRSAALAERGGVIRPIIHNRVIHLLQGVSTFGPNFMKPLPASMALERMAILEGRSVAWLRARLGERFSEWFLALARTPNAAMEALARRLHDLLLSERAVAAAEVVWYRRGIQGWLNRIMGRTMAETIRRGHGVADDVALEYAVSVPWLRDFIRTELYSVGILTAMNVYQRFQAGTLVETTPQIIADGGMDLALMFFIIMRSPSRVDRISRVSPRDLAPGRSAVYVAHPYTRSATMLTPILALSSGFGQATTLAFEDEPIDTIEKWERFLRQARNRVYFDVANVSIFSPVRSTGREHVHESFQGGNLLGRMAINGYYAFDFTVLCYPVYIYGRDALGLDRLPPRIRTFLGDGRVFMTVRTPDSPDVNDALLPTSATVLSRFAL